MRKYALVVHPDYETRVLLERWARSEGYLPHSVQHGTEAIQVARYAHIDLIVLDRLAPQSEYWDVILGLMTGPRSARIPIVFANSDANDLPILVTSHRVN